MTRRTGPLGFRKPLFAFIAIGMVAALLLHGVCWLLVTGLLSTPPVAFNESQRQAGLAIWWIAASIFLWSIYNPTSRFKAALLTLGCVLFVGAAGTIAVIFTQLQHPNDYSAGVHIVVLLSVLIAQTLLAIPASALLQWIVLRPAPAEADTPPLP